jgi:hypothetical protein
MRAVWRRIAPIMQRIVHWGDRRVPWGVRSLIGLLFVVGGVVGFLPILGFWMVPAGLAFIALDVPPLRRHVLAWVDRQAGGGA